MDDEKFMTEGSAGFGLEGDALEKARYKALGDLETEFGNAEGGLKYRQMRADLENKERDNTINSQIMAELAYLRGQGAVRNLDARSYSAEGSGADAYSTAARRDALLPGDLEKQGLGNQRLSFDLDADRQRLGLELTGTRLANTGLALKNRGDAVDLRYSLGTEDGKIDATNAKNALGTNTDEAALASQTAEQNIMAKAAGMEFDTLQAGNDWVISQIEGSGDIGPERKLALVQTLQKHGVTKIAGMSAEIKSAAELAIQAGGLEGLVDYYDTIDDGGSLQVVENSDGTVRVLKNDDFGQTVLMEGPREVVQGQLTAQLTNPSTAMEVAAAALDMQATKATIGLTKNQALVSAVRKDAVQASTDLAKAQVDKIEQEIKTAKAGLGTKRTEIAYTGLASLMESEAYQYLLEENPEAAENARKTYLQAFGLLTPKTAGGGDGPAGDGEGLAGGGDGIGERPSELHSDYPWDKNMASLWANMSPGSRAAFSKPETPTRVDPKADKSGGLATNVVPPSQTGEPWNAAKAPAGFPQSEWDASDATKRKRILKTLNLRALQANK